MAAKIDQNYSILPSGMFSFADKRRLDGLLVLSSANGKG